MTENRLRLGLVGCGQMGHYYAHNLKKRTDAEIAVCCDPSKKKLKGFMEKWGIPGGTIDWRDLFESGSISLDGIINCSVDSLHQEIFSFCLEAGIPLFTEKPLAVPPQNLAAADQKQLNALPFVVNFSKRTIPAVAGALDFIRNGGLGRLSRLEFHYRQGWLYNQDFGNWRDTSAWFWRLTNRFSHHGVLGDLGSHLFDLALLFGGEIDFIFCRSGRSPKFPEHHRGEVLDSFDDAVCTLEYSSGALGLVSMSRTVSGVKDGLEILLCGEKGSLRLNPEESRDSYELFKAGRPVSDGWEKVVCTGKPKKNHDLFIDLLSGEKCSGYPGMEAAAANELLIGAAVLSATGREGIDIQKYRSRVMGV